jgi:hypothetical protein
MIRSMNLNRMGCLRLHESDAEVETSEKNDGNHQDRRPADIPLAGGHLLIFPDAVCEAIEHGNLLKGRYDS